MLETWFSNININLVIKSTTKSLIPIYFNVCTYAGQFSAGSQYIMSLLFLHVLFKLNKQQQTLTTWYNQCP